jgi:hypothetical protein
MERIEAVVRKVEGLSDPRTGLVPNEVLKGDELKQTTT